MSKWTFLFVFLGIINTHGTVYSQNEQQVTISMKNAYLKDILWEIQRQTTFVFMYHEEDLDKVGKVNVEAKSLDCICKYKRKKFKYCGFLGK